MERGRGGVCRGWCLPVALQSKCCTRAPALRPFELPLCTFLSWSLHCCHKFTGFFSVFLSPHVSFYVRVWPFFLALLASGAAQSAHLLFITLVRPAPSPHPPRLTPSAPFSITCAFLSCHFRSHFSPVFVKSSALFACHLSCVWFQTLNPSGDTSVLK